MDELDRLISDLESRLAACGDPGWCTVSAELLWRVIGELKKVNLPEPAVMIRDKEDLMRGLNACKDGNCDDCPFGDIGCSSPLASDALTVIEELERQIKEKRND